MAPPPIPSSRRRRPPNKAKPRFPWLQVISITSMIVLLLSSQLQFPDFIESPTTEGELNLKRNQCKESCQVTLSTNGYSITGPKSSASLSSSAVSAIFSLREGESYVDLINLQDVTDIDASPSRDNLPTDLLDSSDFIENVMKRPRRLPQLIEELVGTLDSDYTDISGTSPSTNKINGGQNLLRRERKQSKDEQLRGITKHGLEGLTVGDDSVSLVAAAAAAAVLSDTEAKRVSLRMKTINGEWEEALRWISSWGRHVQSAKGSIHREGDHSSKNIGVKRKQIRRKRHSQFNAENEIDFEMVLEVCIERCLGDEGEERSNRYQSNGEKFDMVTNNMYFETTWGVNHILSSVISILHGIGSIKNSMQKRLNKQVIQSIFAVVISTFTLWLLRNVNDRRKAMQYTNSLRLLLEEETRDVKINDCASKYHHSSSKKTKKSRKKRRDKRVSQQERSHITTLASDDESETSEVSMEDQLSHAQELERKNSEDQVSKEGNTTVSSCTTDGVEFEYRMMSTDATIMKHKANHWERKHVKEQVSSKTANDGSCTNTFRKERNFGTTKRGDKKKTGISIKSPAHNHEVKPDRNNYCNTLVPTPEQREEAARKLREFQQSQIQRIINAKKGKHVSNQLDSDSHVKQIIIRDVANSHNVNLGSGVNKKVASICPPPGLTDLSPNEQIHGTKKDENVDNADAGYLLSLLDEEDEEEPRPKNATSPDRYICISNEQVRSIALGDLLAGTYSGSSTGKLNTFSSNPWTMEESIGGSTSTAETFINSPSRSSIRNSTSASGINNDMYCPNDANFCLQVSAMEFSPSMDNGDDRTW